jgi:hypothetical protein
MLGEHSCQTATRFKKITDPIRPHQPLGLVPRKHPIGALACADEAEETRLIGCQITAAWRVVADFPPGAFSCKVLMQPARPERASPASLVPKRFAKSFHTCDQQWGSLRRRPIIQSLRLRRTTSSPWRRSSGATAWSCETGVNDMRVSGKSVAMAINVLRMIIIRNYN